MEQEKTVSAAAETSMIEDGATRRDFLAGAATVAGAVLAGAALAPKAAEAAGGMKTAGGIPVPVADAKKLLGGTFPKGTVMATPAAKGANDRISIGFVGVGGQGFNAHVRSYADRAEEWNVMPVAVCDAFTDYQNRASDYIKKKTNADKIQIEKDYRKILERKDIDAIVVATPEHWHGQVGVHAMQAGKHVYIEKPMARYIDEAFQIHDTAVSTKRVLQVGSQGCTDVRWHAAAKAIKEGKLGKRIMGQSSYTRINPRGEWNYAIENSISKETFDWDLWLGSAPQRPWNFLGGAGGDQQPNRDDTGSRFRRYRKYWDYSAGILGDLMPHRLHPFVVASGNPEYPSKVVSIGTNGIQNKDREVADTVQVIAEFPSGWSLLFVGSTVNEQGVPDMFRCEKGTVYFSNGVEARPERPYSEEFEAFKVDTGSSDLAQYARYENIPDHQKNWLGCIRTQNQMTNCNYELATKVQTIISLAEMSHRLNKAVLFDEKTRKISFG